MGVSSKDGSDGSEGSEGKEGGNDRSPIAHFYLSQPENCTSKASPIGDGLYENHVNYKSDVNPFRVFSF